jgi:hypothetical protein
VTELVSDRRDRHASLIQQRRHCPAKGVWRGPREAAPGEDSRCGLGGVALIPDRLWFVQVVRGAETNPSVPGGAPLPSTSRAATEEG